MWLCAMRFMEFLESKGSGARTENALEGEFAMDWTTKLLAVLLFPLGILAGLVFAVYWTLA